MNDPQAARSVVHAVSSGAKSVDVKKADVAHTMLARFPISSCGQSWSLHLAALGTASGSEFSGSGRNMSLNSRL